MTTATTDRRIFRTMLRAIAADQFTADDYRAARASLKSGEMVGVLESIFDILGGLETSKSVSRKQPASIRKSSRSAGEPADTRNGGLRSANALLDDVKRRKISRQTLENYIASLDRRFASDAGRFDTMRLLLSAFRQTADDRQWELLTALVNGDYENDDYLMRISG